MTTTKTIYEIEEVDGNILTTKYESREQAVKVIEHMIHCNGGRYNLLTSVAIVDEFGDIIEYNADGYDTEEITL